MALLPSYRRSPVEEPGVLADTGYFFFSGLSRTLCRLLFRTRYADVAELPDGPVILVANHRSFIDPLVLGGSVDRRVTYMMHAKYYDKPSINWFCRMARCIVVEDPGENLAALRAAIEVLKAGKVVGIFPEGHISVDGTLQPLQPGLAFMARRSGAPVVPVWIGGTREVLPRGAKRLRIAPVTVRSGPPIRIGDFPDGRAGQEAFLAAVRAEFERLSNGDARRREHR